jgi:carboxyl-terminal processing protease
MTDRELFDICGDMLKELRDGHTNLIATHDVSRYWIWEQWPVNYDERIIDQHYLNFDYKMASGIKYQILPDNFGYMYYGSFSSSIGEGNLDLILSYLSTADGLIIDVRNNGGGLMNEAVDIVNIWVKSSELVVETKGKVASTNIKSRTRLNPEDLDIPLAVLINDNSASASEIVSGSLQDLDRAVIIGERSYGKGLVQNILPMPYNSQMKVTVSKYFIPSGRCIQAIDYKNRDANGRALKVPDSLKTAFKTRNGRTVYDGFGIEPDIEVQHENSSLLSVALYNRFHFFNYAMKYHREHASVPPAGEFKITDEIWNDFVSYLSDKTYDYKTYTENIIADLRKVAEEENYMDNLKQQIDQLEKTYKDAKKEDLNRNREEISELLADAILLHYYYRKGCIEAALSYDPDVKKAVEILGNTTEYNKILGR